MPLAESVPDQGTDPACAERGTPTEIALHQPETRERPIMVQTRTGRRHGICSNPVLQITRNALDGTIEAEGPVPNETTHTSFATKSQRQRQSNISIRVPIGVWWRIIDGVTTYQVHAWPQFSNTLLVNMTLRF
ncbi:hypothetical protein [Halomonas sp. THAF5a]|uniref:hypothetical protein n=1 Tax=Halomonas sp. THAF5a TaxID=2587844 RepID=UPI001268C4F1|nr:hypothetical protein [Halomonas sp. THAF5a]